MCFTSSAALAALLASMLRYLGLQVQELLPGAFGAASYGMTGCWDPVVPDTQRFARDVRGTALTGSYTFTVTFSNVGGIGLSGADGEKMTKDLALITTMENPTVLNSRDFILAIREELEK